MVAGNNLTTTKAVAEVDSVAQLNPSKVFIMVGLNDVNFGSKSAEAIAEDLITYCSGKESKIKIFSDKKRWWGFAAGVLIVTTLFWLFEKFVF